MSLAALALLVMAATRGEPSAPVDKPLVIQEPLPGQSTRYVPQPTGAVSSLANLERFERPVRRDLRIDPGREPVACIHRGAVVPATEWAAHIDVMDQHVSAVWRVSVDAVPLDTAFDGDSFALAIPGDEGPVVVDFDKVIDRGMRTRSAVGAIRGAPGSFAQVIRHRETVYVETADYRTRSFTVLRQDLQGGLVLMKLDPDSFTAVCGGSPVGESHASGGPALEKTADVVVAGDPTNTIDIVVGYGAASRVAAGSTSAMEAKIVAGVNRTNTAYANSDVEGVVGLVLLATAEDPDYVEGGSNSSSLSEELFDLSDGSDGTLDAISDLRTAFGADFQAFIPKNAQGSAAGVAFVGGVSSVTVFTALNASALTFEHEVGHNVGCLHSWNDSSGDTSTTTNRYGLRFQTTGGANKYRTIMAYNNGGWTRVLHYSNPSVDYMGDSDLTTGRVDGYDATGDANMDPDYVTGGFDGTNPSLGANNSKTHTDNAASAAGVRTAATVTREVTIAPERSGSGVASEQPRLKPNDRQATPEDGGETWVFQQLDDSADYKVELGNETGSPDVAMPKGDN